MVNELPTQRSEVKCDVVRWNRRESVSVGVCVLGFVFIMFIVFWCGRIYPLFTLSSFPSHTKCVT